MVKVRYTVPQVQYSEIEKLNGEEFFAKKLRCYRLSIHMQIKERTRTFL